MLTEKQIVLEDVKSLLLHICCAPDAVFVVSELIKDKKIEIGGFFYDPNIHPEEEYDFRLKEMKDLSAELGFTLFEGEYDDDRWYELVKGLEDVPEKGERCRVCIEMRLRRTAKKAKELGYEAFATVLTNSPKKIVSLINEAGHNAALSAGVKYIESSFRKSEGFKKSLILSEKYNLYRQNYCGCVYSRRDPFPDKEEQST